MYIPCTNVDNVNGLANVRLYLKKKNANSQYITRETRDSEFSSGAEFVMSILCSASSVDHRKARKVCVCIFIVYVKRET